MERYPNQKLSKNVDIQRTGKLQQVKEKSIKSVSDEKVARRSAKAKAKAEEAAKAVEALGVPTAKTKKAGNESDNSIEPSPLDTNEF